MTRYATTDNNGRIVSTAEQDIIVGGVLFGFPDDFDFSEQGDYLIVNSDLVHDPVPAQGQDHIDISGLREDVDYLLIAEMTREGLL